MITNNDMSKTVRQDYCDVRASVPLLQKAQLMRLEKGPMALMDIEIPAFVRKLLTLGLPEAAAPRLNVGIPAPISRLLNIVLGQDGIVFPLEEN